MPSATTPTPCSCCGEVIACGSLEGRTRGGTATLIGYSEYTTPSTPPKKYRRQTIDGAVYKCRGNTTNCTWTSVVTDTESYSGYCQYHPVTGAITNLQYRLQRTSTPGCAPVTSGGSPDQPWGAGTPWNAGPFTPAGQLDNVLTRLLRTISGNGICVESFGNSSKFSGTATGQLSDEDTEEDAWNRLNPSWSVWRAAGAPGCTGTPAACLIAKWELRGAGDFSTTRQDCEYRVIRTGLTPYKAYYMDFKMYRRAYGSIGAWTLLETQRLLGIADDFGSAHFENEVPNEPGFETYVSCS